MVASTDRRRNSVRKADRGRPRYLGLCTPAWSVAPGRRSVVNVECFRGLGHVRSSSRIRPPSKRVDFALYVHRRLRKFSLPSRRRAVAPRRRHPLSPGQRKLRMLLRASATPCCPRSEARSTRRFNVLRVQRKLSVVCPAFACFLGDRRARSHIVPTPSSKRERQAATTRSDAVKSRKETHPLRKPWAQCDT